MKRSTKRSIAVSCALLATGCFLIAAGHGMGGRLGGGRSISIGGSDGVRIASSGIHIGGSNGVYVGPEGISIGGRNGIYVGPAGIRIGRSGTAYYTEEEPVTIVPEEDRILQEGRGEATFYVDKDMSIQNIKVEPFEDIEINVDLGDISVVQDGNEYFVELQSNIEGYVLRYELDGSKLVIWSKGEGSFPWSGTANVSAQVTIIIPERASLDDMNLFTDLGDIMVVELDRPVSSATLYSALGNINWVNTQVKELTAESALGDVNIILPTNQGVSYDLSTDLGSVQANGDKMGGEASYTARDERCYVIAHSDLGDVNLDYAGIIEEEG